ncbi:MAG TPA: TonB-dependent receptor [Gemmatimonadales bacterium]|nr:TonB-dependent receptor [Gemmatimonadales bacterium]
MTGIASLLVLAQIAGAGRGSISGALRDLSTGDPLAGAVVTVMNLDRSVITDADGRYRIDRLNAGSYRLTVRRIGYAPRTLQALVPPDGNIEITIALQAEPILLGAIAGEEDEPMSRSPDRNVEVAALRDHPLLAEPDVLQALGGSAVLLQPEAPSGIHVRGGGSDQVEYLLDGIPVFSPYRSGEALSGWNPDALAGVELKPASEAWDALSGVVVASTRTPREQHHAQTGFSTTQMRLTLDGPLGSGAGYLYSQRWAFPGFPRPQREGTYVRGESGDQLAKIESPFVGGRVRILGYDTETELDAAGPYTTRNTFVWRSRSVGADWKKPWGSALMRARAWLASGNAGALWGIPDSTADRLSGTRNDAGISFTLEGSRTTLGARVQQSHMTYRTIGTTYDTRALLAALFLERREGLGSNVELLSSIGATTSAGAFRVSPRMSLYWRPATGVTLSGSYARLHQFAQSLRNPESVAGAIFPADLFVGAGRSGIPIARSDQGIVAADYQPTSRVRITAQGYRRSFRNLALVAPGTADPFATGAITVGTGEAKGLALELTATGDHVAALASYGRQQVRLRYGQSAYVPNYGVAHAVDAGVMLHPTHAFSVRVGASGRFGRHATPLATPFEWESCNMADRGCEFVGSPRAMTDSLGATRLPAYVRVDVGVRNRWHMRVAGRTSELAVYGTLTNIFARSNVLIMAPDQASGSRTAVTMRSRAPLVLGVDWSF